MFAKQKDIFSAFFLIFLYRGSIVMYVENQEDISTVRHDLC